MKNKNINWNKRYLIFIIAIFSSFPFFILIYPYTPILTFTVNTSEIRLDPIILFLIVLSIILFLLIKFNKFVYLVLSIVTVFFSINSIVGGYGFKQVFDDYYAMLLSIEESTKLKHTSISSAYEPFIDAILLQNLVDIEQQKVRKIALEWSVKNFQKLHYSNEVSKISHCLSIFKEVNSHFKYISDPKNQEYFTPAYEVLESFKVDNMLKGDCDEHALLMVSLIKNVGGTTRLIRTKKHIYPELLIGNRKDFEKIKYYITYYWFPQILNADNIYYHIDGEGRIWLNLDYTANYPGGKFMENNIIGILEI